MPVAVHVVHVDYVYVSYVQRERRDPSIHDHGLMTVLNKSAPVQKLPAAYCSFPATIWYVFSALVRVPLLLEENKLLAEVEHWCTTVQLSDFHKQCSLFLGSTAQVFLQKLAIM